MKALYSQKQLFWMFVILTVSLQNAYAVDFPEITARELKSKMDSGKKLILINPMSDIEFAASHIPGSVNIPLHEIMRSKKLPKDHNHLIVTYCLGPD